MIYIKWIIYVLLVLDFLFKRIIEVIEFVFFRILNNLFSSLYVEIMYFVVRVFRLVKLLMIIWIEIFKLLSLWKKKYSMGY